MEGYLEGNELYLSGRSAEAVDAYSRALASEFDFELKLKTYLNRAQCFLRTEQFEQAVDDCTYVLARLSDLPPTEKYLLLKFKCFLRRSIAFEHIGNYVKALGDVEAVLDGCPPISLRKAALSSRANLKTFVELDRSVAAGEGRPTMMVTDAQALRLSFLLEPPRSFVVGTPYNIRLCITNELGLWNRSLLQPGVEGGASDKPLLTCSLLCTDSDGERATGNKLVVRIKRTDRPSGLQDSLLQVGEDGKLDVEVTLEAHTDEDTRVSFPPSFMDFSSMLVMMRFSLDRPIGKSGEVLPLLSLPATVQRSTCNSNNNNYNNSSCSSCAMEAPSPHCSSLHAEIVQQCSAVHATCVREMTVSVGSAPAQRSLCVYALESPGYLGIAGKVWDSMYVLLQYLAQHTERLVHRKRVLELGCGTGLAGISLCALGPESVTLTDMVEVVPLITANVLLNSAMVADPRIQEVLLDRYRAAAYCWGDSLKLSTGTMMTDLVASDPTEPVAAASCATPTPYFDVILASDVVYYPEGYAPLLTTLCDLLATAPTASAPLQDAQSTAAWPVCILAHRHRHPEDKRFFDALFATPELRVVKLDFQAQHTGEGSNIHALKDVILFEITRKH